MSWKDDIKRKTRAISQDMNELCERVGLQTTTTEHYLLSVIETPHLDTLTLASVHTGNLEPFAELTLQPGEGNLTLIKDNVPYQITAGLTNLCTKTLALIERDTEWKKYNDELSLITARAKALSNSEELTPQKLDAILSATKERDQKTTISIEGLLYFSNIHQNRMPLFPKLDRYNSHAPTTYSFISALQKCNQISPTE